MTKELSGACGCGAVHYKITGSIRVVVNCHCNTCRKNNGASYSTYCVVAQDDLNLIEGHGSITTYEVSGGGEKRVCAKCGSPLYNAHPRYPGMSMVYYGSLLENSSVIPSFNIYCENRVPWVESISAIKSFEQSIER